MSTTEVRLLRRERIAHATTAFHFSKPAGFTFKAGQAVDLILPGANAAEGDDGRHAFSIVSAPHENELVFATRMRDSAFKNALKDLPIGSAAQIDGPFGALTLHRDAARPAVLIAGGIGITPFISILRRAASEEPQRRITLLYANRRPQDSAFLAELQRLAQENSGLRLVATMTAMRDSGAAWPGETRPIDQALVSEIGAALGSPVYYLAGPPGMVRGLQATLAAAGIDDEDVRVEEFYGY
jgi:ferredoxin-NADP reductase